MVQVICVMTWHPYDGLMHCYRSQCGETSPCTIMDLKEVSWKLKYGTFIPMHNAQVK
jgi:hypothetical protein